MGYTNLKNISLPIAAWLVADDYDFVPDGKSISVTSLIKPVRQILLRERLEDQHRLTPDVSDRLASRMGSSLHDGIERAWTRNYQRALRLLNYPEKFIERVKINPETVAEGDVPVYFEQRGSREILGYTISGKFDMVLNGELNDFKSTSTFSYTNRESKEEQYRLQLSIYRWIHQDKITKDYANIQFLFTDWQGFRAKADPNYPQTRAAEFRIELMSLAETEQWLRNHIRELERFHNADEKDIPFCTDKDLWRSDPVWKHYATPTSVKATKVFEDEASAQRYLTVDKKGKGLIRKIDGKVKACGYCDAFLLCTQKDRYEHD